MCFFKKKNISKNKTPLDPNKMPKHIAFIADGNGRWALSRGLVRVEGHRVGAKAIEKVVKRCMELAIPVVSFYCFSTENFSRPEGEVNFIFNLFREYKGASQKFIDRGIKFRLMGDKTLFPKDMQEIIDDLSEKTKDCDKIILNFGFGYGSRHEIVGAVNKILKEGKEQVTEEEFAHYLYTDGLPDPDLIVRASGEHRLSNFMLYQAAYSEFYFPNVHWPDFDADVVDDCVREYQSRHRRYGKI